jgi:hypothetical protein
VEENMQDYSFSCALYVHETWSLTSKEGNRLRVFLDQKGGNNRMWEKLHNEELQDLYSAPDITRVIKSHTVR